MPAAQEFDQVAPGIFVWQAYDRTVKADLFSTALETAEGVFLVGFLRAREYARRAPADA